MWGIWIFFFRFGEEVIVLVDWRFGGSEYKWEAIDVLSEE